VGCFLWSAWCEFPQYAWNEIRLAPAFALRHGINPYPPLGGGPLSTWIYGPVSIVLNLPATWASTAAGAVQISNLINLLVTVGAPILIFFRSAELRQSGSARPWLAAALGILLLSRFTLVFQVADHSAISLGLLSCWCLTRDLAPRSQRLALAAALCALAVGSKQTAVFLEPAQLAFLIHGGQRRAAWLYGAWLVGFGLLFLGLAAWIFGGSNLWLNLVTIPARIPWTDDIVHRLGSRCWPLLGQVVAPSLGLVLLGWRRMWPSRDRESGRFFQLTVLVFLALLPIGLLGFLKFGGDTNLLNSWNYLMVGSLLAWLVREPAAGHASWRMLAVAALALGLHGGDFARFPDRPSTGHFQIAAQITALSPQAVWFPQNPVITFYSDHRLWHSEDGVLVRDLAGYGLREEDFRRYLPPNLQAVMYPSVVKLPFAIKLLPQFNQVHGIPFWTVYTAAATNPRPENGVARPTRDHSALPLITPTARDASPR
jgi:hypothetical protein